MSLFPTPAASFDDARYARVVVERGIDRVGGHADAGLTYRVSGFKVDIGQQVHVPLGRSSKPTLGVVIKLGGRELLDGLDPGRVKPILNAAPAALPPRLVELAEWMSRYYVCPLGMVFATMLPAAVKKQIGRKTVIELQRIAPGPEADAKAAALKPRLRKSWDALLALDSAAFPLTAKALAASVEGLSTASIKKLVETGLLVGQSRQEVVSSADPLIAATAAGAPPTRLSSEQQAAIDGMAAGLGGFGTHLLHGVTASGKTEVYLRLLERALERDSDAGAIVLVPEIALTPQTAGRFLSRFSRVAVLHSGMTAAQRHRQWAACASGAVRVVVGARSAIFAPLRKLGLIIVDEEHDSSYKQDQLPRYHARDLAIKRASIEACPVVLGSATPSLESWANTAANAGATAKYRLWTLPNRVTGTVLPRVQVVDLAEERRQRAQGDGWRDRHVHLIGPTLEHAVGRALDAGGQVMLLLNRRGYANYLCCPDPKCGWVMRCDQCDAASVFHLASRTSASTERGFVRCHHCLAEQLLPARCPVCAKAVNTFGQGTQRVEEELERKFAGSHGIEQGRTLVRVDTDSMQSAADYFEVLDRFARGEVRILLGTQMIAKGLDFPNVQLVGVVNADTALVLPDFRAAERTFQLVAQVAGRAGRGDKPGLVIVQTFSPDVPAIRLAAKHDYVSFANQELALRRHAGLPPATRMARIVCRDEVLPKAETAARDLAAALRASAQQSGVELRLNGPMPCPVSRIAGHHRIALELVTSNRTGLQEVLARVRAQGLLTSDAHTAVDIDPVAMM